MATTTKSRKAKGRRLQNLVAERVRKAFDLSDKDVSGAIMGESGLDIKLSDKARREFPFAVECKSYKAFAVYKHWLQCIHNAKLEDLEPLLVIKQDRSQPLAVVDLEYFFQLLEMLDGYAAMAQEEHT